MIRFAAGVLTVAICGAAVAADPAAAPPRLILQITVDALRGDLPYRYLHRMGEGGFRRLMDQGVQYRNAHYEHANTETIVGHVSLATGAVPAVHGMVANVWFDRGLGRLAYNIEDGRYRLLTAGATVDQRTEIDPTQKAAKVEGRSPRGILASTLSDEMAVGYAGRSKIFAVSVKDRGAVSMAGQAGKAFWFSKATGEFVTSTYYYARYPDWVAEWNRRKPALAYAGKRWSLLNEPSSYLFGAADDRAYETDFPGFGRTFPHPYGEAGDKYLTTRLTLGPAGDELTLDFAKAIVENERLGEDEVPDYLSVSFSSNDYVLHLFGASSLEAEDNLLRLDRLIADLLRFIDGRVGLSNTLIVLSADHGSPEVPGYMNALGVEDAHYFDAAAMDRAPAIAALKRRFGIGKELIREYFHPYLYLNRAAMREKGLDQAEVERAVAGELAKLAGITAAVPSSDLRAGRFPDSALHRAVLNNFHPKRSGDIYLVFDPNVFINDFDGLRVASVHGSPWKYDTHVPVIFAGAGLRPQTVSRQIAPYDIAPTIAALLGIRTPSGAAGKVLPEIR